MSRRLSLPSIVTLLLVILPLPAAAFGPAEFHVNTYTTDDQFYPRVASDAGGDFVVVWDSYTKDGDTDGVFAQRFTSTATPVGPEFQVNTYTTGSQYTAAVAKSAGTFVVVWDDGDYYGSSYLRDRVFTSTGVPLGPPHGTIQAGYDPQVAMAPSGEFVVVTTSFYSYGSDGPPASIVATRFDAAGNELGTFQVNSYTTGGQRNPQVGMVADGRFVVVWASPQDPNSVFGFGVYGQRFDSAGNPTGGEFRVNEAVTYDQSPTGIAVDAAGDFVVVWNTNSLLSNDLFARRFDSTGAPLGGDFQVNTTPLDACFLCDEPAGRVAFDAAGNFMISWFNEHNDMKARRFDSAGVPQGDEFLVERGSNVLFGGDIAGVGNRFVVVWDGYEAGVGEGTTNGVFGTLVPTAITGKKLTIVDSGAPNKQKVIFLSKDPQLDTTPATGVDPTTDGAFLQVYNSNGGTDSACLPLVAAGWSAKGDPAKPTFKFKNPNGALGPCKSAVLKGGKLLKARCLAITYSLDEASQGSVAVRFTSGATSLCSNFGGTVIKDSMHVKFSAAGAPLGSCPAPPASCP